MYETVDYTMSRTVKPLGVMMLRLFGYHIAVTGGPYAARPANMVGVKMAAEINMPCDISIPTKDFQTPPAGRLFWGVHDALVQVLVEDQLLYVGCMAGKGRTGLFMAVLAYVAGHDDPVAYVREHYYQHAVETKEQEAFVLGFNRDRLRLFLMQELVSAKKVDFHLLRRMTWAERWLFLRVWWGRR